MAIPFAAAMPMRSPVNEPGPWLTATASRSLQSMPAAAIMAATDPKQAPRVGNLRLQGVFGQHLSRFADTSSQGDTATAGRRLDGQDQDISHRLTNRTISL